MLTMNQRTPRLFWLSWVFSLILILAACQRATPADTTQAVNDVEATPLVVPTTGSDDAVSEEAQSNDGLPTDAEAAFGLSLDPLDLPQPAPGEMILGVDEGEGACRVVALGGDRGDAPVAIGPCYSEFGFLPYSAETPYADGDLAYFITTYAPFSAETAAGYINFGGTGDRVANAAEQRQIAAWARAVAAAALNEDDFARVVFEWHREGGLAGFCDNVQVWSTGEVVTYVACGDDDTPQETQRRYLSGDDAALLFEWLTTYRAEMFEISDGPVAADGMVQRVQWNGSGSQILGADGQQALLQFGSTLFVVRLSDAPALPQPDAAPQSIGLCPDVLRPALLAFTGANYAILNPLTGQRCDVALPSDAMQVQYADGALYYSTRDMVAQVSNIWRWTPQSRGVPIVQSAPDAGELISFVVSADGTQVAWATLDQSQSNAQEAVNLSRVWQSPIQNIPQPVQLVEFESRDGYVAQPVRFSAENSALYVARQPYGIGGMWNGFVGRYHALSLVDIASAAEQTLLDCDDLGRPLCIGDFTDYAIAYVDAGQTVNVVGQDGSLINVLNSAETDYVGYPTFGPDGTLIWYAATLDEADLPRPTAASYYQLPIPYTGEPDVVLSGASLLTPRFWLGGQRFVGGAVSGDRWGSAIYGLEGLQSEIDGVTDVVGVVPAIGADSTQAAPVSADGLWWVQTTQSEPEEVDSAESDQFPTGSKYRVTLTAGRFDGSRTVTVVDEYRSYGLGYTFLKPIRWSQDGRYLYFTNVAVPDGCGGYVNGSDLQRVDLTNGAVEQLIDGSSSLMSLAPGEAYAAYFQQDDGGPALVVRTLADGTESRIALPEGISWGRIGPVTWSPDGTQLLVQQWVNDCVSPAQTGLWLVDWLDGALTRISEPDERRLTVVAWPQDGPVQLRDAGGSAWVLALDSAEITLAP